jgi:hypothetical protein
MKPQHPNVFGQPAAPWAGDGVRNGFPPLHSADGWANSLRLVNLCPSGFHAADDGRFELGDELGVVLPGIGEIACEIVSRSGGNVQARFLARRSLRLLFCNGIQKEEERLVPARRMQRD